ncbi:hypothetical protein GYMLUDRAFT_47317 [Collybiopsis luxurians FD-317 M1]|uniref:Uncharacterized protein n=1 Tax=Collybiopsis luxurians FD-317 M1 TaxID=944289 RepID=A0A0D0CDG5_9AGAR|nr:hypothetical protein GYMLUDRAFT_47317 [Collybiopsis luxurians FD-317 M1]
MQRIKSGCLVLQETVQSEYGPQSLSNQSTSSTHTLKPAQETCSPLPGARGFKQSTLGARIPPFKDSLFHRPPTLTVAPARQRPTTLSSAKPTSSSTATYSSNADLQIQMPTICKRIPF